MKKRGRPRGHDLTTIGLPAKKTKRAAMSMTKPSTFSCLDVAKKEEGNTHTNIHLSCTSNMNCIYIFTVMLSWFVDKKISESALKEGVLIEEEHVECRPEKVSDAVADENVDLNLIRKHFTYDGWMVCEQVINKKAMKMEWKCNVCHHDLGGDSVACDCCLLWYHFTCVGLTKHPKTKYWFCRSCYSSATSAKIK